MNECYKPPIPPIAPLDKCGPKDPCAPHCKPDPHFPGACPPPMPRPIPCMPPAPSVVEGQSLYEAVNNLTDRVNTCIHTYNDVMSNCYATLHNLQRAAEENGAYYNNCEVWTEQGYDANSSATYTLIHKAVVDRCGEPIRIQMHLAYNNTTNSKIEQNLFSASKVTYADKIVVAQPMGENGWYGNAIWNGAPIATSEEPTLYTVGFTRAGIMRVYSNSVCVDQMLRDTIENAMGCSGVLIQNGQVTDETWRQNIPNANEQVARICMGQNLETREVIFLVCGNENDVNRKGMTSKACADILLQYGCDIAVELCEGSSAGACDKGSLMFVPDGDNVPNAYAFWYISRKCFFRNDYQRELAELMQNYGRCIWETFLNYKRIVQLRIDLEAEINNREDADKVLQDQILEEIQNRVNADEELQRQILEEVQNRVNADEVLQNQILEEVKNRVNADNVLQEQITKEIDDRTKADAVLQEQITTEVNARIAADEELQRQILETTENLQGQINEEITNRTNADKVLQDQIDAEIQHREDADQSLQQQINAEVQNRVDADAALQQQILTEQGARIAADESLQNQINAEITNRIEADANLKAEIQAKLDDINIRLTEIEGDLGNLKTLYDALQEQTAAMDAAITALQTTIASIETSLNNIKELIEQIRSGEIVLPYLPLKGGTMEGDINMSYHNIYGVMYMGFTDSTGAKGVSQHYDGTTFNFTQSGGTDTNIRIAGVADPVNDNEAVNKKFLMDTLDQIEPGGLTKEEADKLYLSLNGGTMNGIINMNNNTIQNIGTPVNNTDAVNKEYVDNAISDYIPEDMLTKTEAKELYVNVSGDTMTGALDMGGNKVYNISTPTEDNDAANKAYVDNSIDQVLNNTISEENADKRYVLKTGDIMTGALNVNTDSKNTEVHGGTVEMTDGDNIISVGRVEGVASAVVNGVNATTQLNLVAPVVNVTNTEGQPIQIKNVADPTDDNDAINKKYLDDQIAAAGTGISQEQADARYLKLDASNDPITGDLSLGNNKITDVATPVNGGDAVNKDYLDGAISTATANFITQDAADERYVNVTGDTMSGELNMGNQKITNLGTPTENTDAATKEYVDSHAGPSGDFIKIDGTSTTTAEIPFAQGVFSTGVNWGPDQSNPEIMSLAFTDQNASYGPLTCLSLGTNQQDSTLVGIKSMVGSETSFIGAYNNTSLSKTGTLIGNNENQILINNDTENPAVELYKNNPSVTREQGNLLIRKVASPIKAYDAINAITAYHQNEWWPQSIYGIDTTFPNKPTQVVQKPFDMNVGTAKYHIASYYWSIGLDRPATDPSFKLNPSGVILKDLPFYNSSMDLNEFAYAVTITPTQDWRNQANTYCPPVTGVFTCADVDLTGDKFIYTPVHSIIYENGAWNVKELLWVGFANGYGSEGPAFWHDWVYHPLPLEPITNQGPLALIDVYLIMNDHLL